MRVAGVQFDIVWQDRERNLEVLEERWLPAARAAGAALVVLPEMFATGFSMEVDRIAEPVDGPAASWMADRARQDGCWIVGSLAVQAPGGARNRCFLADPSGNLRHYDKRHPFTFAGEDRSFRPGDDLLTVEIDDIRVTPFVCYDLRFADDFWATGPDTDAFVVVANWPTARREHWRALLRARAIENQCYVVGVNRVGDADGLPHVGDSAVIDPLGNVQVQASGVETLVVGEIDAGAVGATRREFPFLADRRPPPTVHLADGPTDRNGDLS